jgi:hypothetical protein
MKHGVGTTRKSVNRGYARRRTHWSLDRRSIFDSIIVAYQLAVGQVSTPTIHFSPVSCSYLDILTFCQVNLELNTSKRLRVAKLRRGYVMDWTCGHNSRPQSKFAITTTTCVCGHPVTGRPRAWTGFGLLAPGYDINTNPQIRRNHLQLSLT